MEIGYWSTCIWVGRGAWIIYENRSDTIELNPTHWATLPMPPDAPPAAGERALARNAPGERLPGKPTT